MPLPAWKGRYRSSSGMQPEQYFGLHQGGNPHGPQFLERPLQFVLMVLDSS